MTEEQRLTAAMNAYADETEFDPLLSQAWNEHLALTKTAPTTAGHRWRTPLLIAAAVIAVGAAGATAVTATHRPAPTVTVNSTNSAGSTCSADRPIKIVVGQTNATSAATGDAQSGSAAVLVPGAPNAALICRYQGMNSSHPGLLAGTRTLASTETTVLATLFNDGHQTTGTYNCPADYQDLTTATFHYPSGPDVLVTYNASSCRFASNGQVTSTTTTALQGQLTSLLQ